MEQQKKNKALIVRYFNAISGVSKTPEVLQAYIKDAALIEHISFFESVFPRYEMYADEIIAEGDKVVVRARVKGTHEGTFNGIPPTYKKVDFPFVISYTIENEKIIDHWLIADQVAMMEQLGLMSVPQE